MEKGQPANKKSDQAKREKWQLCNYTSESEKQREHATPLHATRKGDNRRMAAAQTKGIRTIFSHNENRVANKIKSKRVQERLG